MFGWLFIKHDPYAVTGRAANAKAHLYLHGKLHTDGENLVLSGPDRHRGAAYQRYPH